MPLYGTVLIPAATPVVSGVSGALLFNSAGVLQTSEQLQYDGSSALTLQTLTDADTSDTGLTLGVHANEANAAALSVSIDGASGNNTPDTTFTFPGFANFELAPLAGVGYFNFNAPIDGGAAIAQVVNTSDTADSTALLWSATTGDNATGSAFIAAVVHQGGANEAQTRVELAGNSGNNTPDTTWSFPGAALFTGASGYSFDNTIIPGSFAFASLPTASTGMMATVTDSNTATWGATIAGGGANNVQARYNGVNWTVVGK